MSIEQYILKNCIFTFAQSPNIAKPCQLLAGQPEGTQSIISSLYIRTALLLGLPCSFLCSNFCCRALFTMWLAIDVVADHDWYASWAVWDAVWGPAIMPSFVCLVMFVLAAFWGLSLWHYIYIYIHMIILRLWRVVMIPSCLLSVSHVCIDAVGSHAPHKWWKQGLKKVETRSSAKI